ncbi:MAG: DNA-binding protein [Rhodocyclaceae bacterium]|nr:DNA-binding protein [Rhodocyclaceae bacterium]
MLIAAIASCMCTDIRSGKPILLFRTFNEHMATEYQPITIERAADILSVSPRTIYNLITDGTLPSPVPLGRRVYWHPDTFYAAINRHFGVPDTPAIEVTKPARRPGRPRAVLPART